MNTELIEQSETTAIETPKLDPKLAKRMDRDTNSDAYKAGERIGHYLTDALKKAGEELLASIQHMEPHIVGDLHKSVVEDEQPGRYTPTGPIVDSTITPIESGVLALPERKAKAQ